MLLLSNNSLYYSYFQPILIGQRPISKLDNGTIMQTKKSKKNKLFSPKKINIHLLVLLVALLYAVVFNYPVVHKIYELSGHDFSLYLASYLLLFTAFTIIFCLFSWPYLFKIVTVPLIISSSLAFYASVKYNVLFDSSMMENIFETNTGEAFSYINTGVILYLIGLGCVPAFLLFKVKVDYGTSFVKTLLSKFALMTVSALVIAIIGFFYYKDYVSIGRNNSYLNKMINPAHAFNTVKYINNTYLTEPIEYLKLGEDARLKPSKNNKPTLMIFVLGETARSQNIGYNGYHRNTNPYTENLGLISFQHVSSCGTATAVSLPCLFSNMGRSEYKKNRAVNQDDVLDILVHAGIKVNWVDNDGGDKKVAQNLKPKQIGKDKRHHFCEGDSCYDEALLDELPALINTDKQRNKLITIHLIGSHGPTYYQRYPSEHKLFTPACERSDIENCTQQEIVNVYDNTIAYTDFVIAKTIKLLKKQQENYNVALIYLSDHGESLGENGLYLHGTPYAIAPEQQTKVPWYLWASDEYFDAKGIDKACLENIALNDSLSHDNLFHTLLGFYGVDTKERKAELDITSDCRS